MADFAGMRLPRAFASAVAAEAAGKAGLAVAAEVTDAVGSAKERRERMVSVYIINAPYPIDRLFDYRIPAAMADRPVHRGTLLCVPFGRGNRTSYAVTDSVRFCDGQEGGREEAGQETVKPVLAVIDEDYALGDEAMELCLFLRRYTLCTFGEAARCMVPPAVLTARGTPSNRKCLRYYARADAEGCEQPLPRGAVQLRLLAFLSENGETEEGELCRAVGAGRESLRALCAKGLVTMREEQVVRDPYAALSRGERDRSPILLSRAQQEAADRLDGLIGCGEPRAALLYGVTGSGKTKVIMAEIDRVIAAGRGVIMMVPEIALTPQTVGIFCRRYGQVAVIHSSLSEGERLDTWNRIRRGEVSLVIGTRSAVFAPLPNIGLIVIDEEHEHTYKSDQNPKYHTRDVAAFRCRVHNAVLLLASATPSLESFYRAQQGIYTLIELRERYGGARLPEVEIVDMREELRRGNRSPISRRLAEELDRNRAEEQQAILFLNRRGYHTSLSCKSCGEAVLCPHCSVALTHHTAEGGGYLLCHCCGYRGSIPRACPSCGSEAISYIGFGTERVESELRSMEHTTLRMDADTTTRKSAYDRLLEDFRRGDAEVLIGTQMVTKGHDFPRVTLVGALLADASLYVNDFRASERTFSLLTQVIGRAGRGELAGRAVIQTYAPDNDVIRLAVRQDYDAFYAREIALRRQTCFPPFCDMVQLTLSSKDEQLLAEEATELSRRLRSEAEGAYREEPLALFGPFEAQTYRVREVCRLRMVIKCRLNRHVRELFGTLLCEYARKRGVSLSVDINPSAL